MFCSVRFYQPALCRKFVFVLWTLCLRKKYIIIITNASKRQTKLTQKICKIQRFLILFAAWRLCWNDYILLRKFRRSILQKMPKENVAFVKPTVVAMKRRWKKRRRVK